jgi:hypothetical protein
LFKAVLGLHMHLLAAMREGGIQFRLADQSVRIEGLVGARVLDAVSLVSGDASVGSAAALGGVPPGSASASRRDIATPTAPFTSPSKPQPNALILPDCTGVVRETSRVNR